jgi:cytochrome c-type biogenesis protein CcsB
MNGLEKSFLLAALISIILTIVISAVRFIFYRKTRNTVINIFTVINLLFLTLTIVFRTIQTGYGPFSNMYEFAIAFSWGIILMGIIFQLRFKTTTATNAGMIIAVLLTIFALVKYTSPSSLVPALQQSVLLSVHVATAVIAYGSFAIGFGASVLFLVQDKMKSQWLPDLDTVDSMNYFSVIIGFPFLTLTIVLGALWADIAWGRYWAWDPKETASLVTWLIFALYIHVRIMRGWRGTRSAILIILGFVAILLTFFGNYFFSGLHAYN